MPPLIGVFDPDWGGRWTRPEGGLFLWVTLPVPLAAVAFVLDPVLG